METNLVSHAKILPLLLSPALASAGQTRLEEHRGRSTEADLKAA